MDEERKRKREEQRNGDGENKRRKEEESSWSIDSWKTKPIKQQPEYPDPIALERVLDQVASYPPLVQEVEVEKLRSYMGEVAKGKRFLLQGGDCAERFVDCTSVSLDAKLKILLQMSLVLVWGGRVPVVRVGRIGGQYAKPRSNPAEKGPPCPGKGEGERGERRDIPVFRGDIVNSHPTDWKGEGRDADPERLLKAYMHSSTTLNYLRGKLSTGFADLHAASKWDLTFVDSEAKRQDYVEVLSSLRHCLQFFSACGATSDSELKRIELFTSHEGLLLNYESALTRKGESGRGWYDLSAHLLWIGDRTRDLDGAHIEFFRGVRNPIGVKVGPTTDPKELVQLIQTLDPKNEPGKLILYSRLGAKKVAEMLPRFIHAVRDGGCTSVVWACDPMHGNTTTTSEGFKTRAFNDIVQELIETFKVHDSVGSRLGGIHFELTGENVTECTGGANEITEQDLHKDFRSYCDPRLNYSQSLEIAFLVAKYLSKLDQ